MRRCGNWVGGYVIGLTGTLVTESVSVGTLYESRDYHPVGSENLCGTRLM